MLSFLALSRSWDGLTLYAASSDGTIAAFQFDPSELEGIASHSDQEQYLSKFGFTPPPLPEGYSHVSKSDPARMAQAQQANGFDSRNASVGPEKVNILVAKRAPKDKKRATLLPNGGSSAVPTTRIASNAGPSSSTPMATPVVNGVVPGSRRIPQSQQMRDTMPQSISMGPQTPSSFPLPSEQPFVEQTVNWSSGRSQPMEVDAAIDALDSVMQSSKGKRKASMMDVMDEKPATIKARTLGGDRPVELHVPKPISNWASPLRPRSNMVHPGPSTAVYDSHAPVLPTPPLLSYLKSELEGTNDVLEAKNVEDTGMFCAVLLSYALI